MSIHVFIINRWDAEERREVSWRNREAKVPGARREPHFRTHPESLDEVG
jgi:hypothetical protein